MSAADAIRAREAAKRPKPPEKKVKSKPVETVTEAEPFEVVAVEPTPESESS